MSRTFVGWQRLLLIIALCLSSLLLTSCSDSGASDRGIIGRTASVSSDSSSNANSSVSDSSSSQSGQVSIGESTFIDIELSKTSLEAQEVLNISIQYRDSSGDLVTPVGSWTVSSGCTRNFNANVSTPQFNPQSVTLSYTPVTCVGEDIIDFELTVEDETIRLQRTIEIAADTVNQILFIGNEPEIIALKGSGLNTQADVTFQVKGISFADGIPGQQVVFELEGDTGGVALVKSSGITDDNGMVTARVQAGTVPGIVVVKARHVDTGVTANSAYITVSTGNTYSAKFRIGASVFNPNARNFINGESTDITVALSDRVGNAVADGTRVRFFAEAGRIPDVCETLQGSCTVTWYSSADEPDNGRVQIFATTKGAEDFIDRNNNFILDDGDEFPSEYDLSEPFLDANQDDVFNLGDLLIDSDKDSAWSVADGLWNGPNCQHSSLCSDVEFADLGVQLTIYTSDDSNPSLCELGGFTNPADGFTVSVGGTYSMSGLFVSDGNHFAENTSGACALGNPLPNGTELRFRVDKGDLIGNTSWTVSSTSVLPFGPLSVNYEAPSTPGGDILILSIEFPGQATSYYFEWSIDVQ